MVANTSVLQDLLNWEPQVHSKVVDLQSSIQDFYGKLKDPLWSQTKDNPAYKTLEMAHLDLSRMVALIQQEVTPRELEHSY